MPISRDIIQKILEAGAQAPSGSNSQPWRFVVKGNTIDIIALPEKDHAILNFHYRGTWLAHGCLIENMAIAALALGAHIQCTPFPEAHNSNITARLTLAPTTGAVNEPLFEAILKRKTNRKIYKMNGLTDHQFQEIQMCTLSFPDVDCRLVTNAGKISALGEAAAVNEIVTLENQALHKLLFEEITWTAQENEEKRSGLYLKTMELVLPQQIFLRIFRSWSFMDFMNRKFHLARMIARDNARGYAATPLMGAVMVADEDKEFFTAGRALERIWLTATKLGLSFHLITGVPFFHQRFASGDISGFSEEHIALVDNAYRIMEDAYTVTGGKVIAGMFRIGQGGEPSACSPKKAPVVEYA